MPYHRGIPGVIAFPRCAKTISTLREFYEIKTRSRCRELRAILTLDPIPNEYEIRNQHACTVGHRDDVGLILENCREPNDPSSRPPVRPDQTSLECHIAGALKLPSGASLRVRL
jgi:hypothetical protein